MNLMRPPMARPTAAMPDPTEKATQPGLRLEAACLTAICGSEMRRNNILRYLISNGLLRLCLGLNYLPTAVTPVSTRLTALMMEAEEVRLAGRLLGTRGVEVSSSGFSRSWATARRSSSPGL